VDSRLPDALLGIFLAGLWVIALDFLGDHLAGVPTLLVYGHDPETEARKQRILTRRLLLRRMTIGPLTIMLPTALLTALLYLVGEREPHPGSLLFLWVLAVMVSAVSIFDSASRLGKARR